MIVGVIVGHDKLKKGARLNLNSETNIPITYEYDWNTAVAKQLEFLRGIYKRDLNVFFRDGVGVYGSYLNCLKTSPDIILELHFNSDAVSKYAGAEVLCSEIHSNSPFPEMFLNRAVELFGGKNRGIKVPDKGKDRGYGNVNRPVPYFLLEPFFGSNLIQAKIASEHMIDYAIVIMEALNEYEEHLTINPSPK